MLFGFDQFELDLGTCELRRAGRAVPLQPRVFSALRYLIEHRDRVVSKQELIDALWGGDKLNAGAVPWTINRLRKAIDDESRAHELIQTARGHGYRFVGDVRLIASRSDVAPAPPKPPEACGLWSEDPFVGRESLLLQLTAAVDAAGDGRGSLCLLTGEAGIGKTRCTNELAVLARRRGLQIWLGRCFDPGMAPVFWPFIQVLRAACNDSSLSETLHREAEALLKELEPQSPAALEHRLVLGDSRFWMLDRLSRWLVRSSHARVRILVLEDIHRADETSIQVLSLLAPLLPHARIFLLATARDDAAGEAAPLASGLTARLRPCEHIALTGLQVEDVQAFLRPALGHDAAARLSSALRLRTAGNPLFVRELARVIAGQWQREGSIQPEDVKLPAAVKDIISQRLQALPALSHSVLDAASVIGEEFTLPVLQRVTALDSTLVLEGLQAARLAHIVVVQADPSKYAFVHPLMREVLYASLATAARANLHAGAGLALEALGQIEPRLSEIAYHFYHAALDRCAEQTARYSRLAGDAALRARAWHEATEFYGWALEAQAQLDPDNVQSTCELLLQRAAALAFSHQRDQARAQCERAIELARPAGLVSILVWAAQLLRPSVWLAHLPDQLALVALEEVLRTAPEAALAERVRAYAQLAVLPPYSLSLAKSREMSDKAVELASLSEDSTLLIDAQRAQLFGLSGPDTIQPLMQVADEILRSDPVGVSRWSVDAQLARYHALLRTGEIAEADRALDAVDAIALEARARLMGWHSDRLRAQRLLAAGQLDEAERRFVALHEEGERIHMSLAPIFFRAQHAALTLERTGVWLAGNYDQRPQSQPFILRSPAFRVRRILLWLEDRNTAAARESLRVLAENEFALVIQDPVALYCLSQLAVAATALREREIARVLRDLLVPYAELTVLSLFSLSMGCVSRYLGLLERFLGRPGRAIEYYDTACRIDARTGQELERMRAALGYARLTDDNKRARAIVEEVRVSAEQAGAMPLRAAALQLATRLGVGTAKVGMRMVKTS